jgi:glycine hydroxymethyltransferase
MHNIAGKAVGFKEALEPEFEEYAAQTVANAKALGESMSEQGFKLVSDGTDNHLILVDLRESHPDVTGNDAADALEAAGIVLNANTVPGETRSAMNPSGIRIGSPGLTSRGFEEDEMREVGQLIGRVLDNIDDESVIAEVSEDVDRLTDEYPLYE